MIKQFMIYKKNFCRLLALTIVIFLGFNYALNVKAEEDIIIINDIGGDASQYDEINEYLMQHAKEILSNSKTRNGYVKLSGIQRLVQTDSRWSNEIMQTDGISIGRAGCCLTSFTMIRNLISNVSDTPSTVNSVMGDNASPFNFYYAASAYGYTILTERREDSGISDEATILNVIGAIDEYSRPVLIGLKKSSGSTHFVVGYGYTLDGDVIICDPAGRNYTMLSQYFDEGYFAHRIYVYTR